MLTSSLSLLLAVVSIVTYLHAQSNDDKLSGLTLANIEALGYDTIGEAIDAGCAGCTGTYGTCGAVVTDQYGNIIASALCPGYYPG